MSFRKTCLTACDGARRAGRSPASRSGQSPRPARTSRPEKPRPSQPPRRRQPATTKVEKGPFKVEVTLPGVFEAGQAGRALGQAEGLDRALVVETAVELGTPVKQGDILVEFDREKIDKAIQDAEVELELGELALKHATEELPILEKLLPIDLAAAERAKTQADEDLARFLEIDRPNSEKMAAVLRQVGRRVPGVRQGGARASSRRCTAPRT